MTTRAWHGIKRKTISVKLFSSKLGNLGTQISVDYFMEGETHLLFKNNLKCVF